MFDNFFMAEIRKDIMSFLPQGVPYNELNILAIWKNIHTVGEYVAAKGKFKTINKTGDEALEPIRHKWDQRQYFEDIESLLGNLDASM